MRKLHFKKYCLSVWFLLTIASFFLPAVFAHDGAVVGQCDVVGSGGDFANVRGLQFTASANFASIEVRMNPAISGIYDFTAELRRSAGFAAPLLAAVRVSATLPVTQPPFTVVHIDFPPISVSGTETFTLRFVDIAGPGYLYFETAGIGNFPCTTFIVTEDQTSASPVIRSSATGMRILAPPAGCSDCPGDLNGDRKVNMADLEILSANWLRVCAPTELPVLTLQGSAMNPTIAEGIASFFKISPAGLLGEDGIIRYTNSQLFQAIPTVRVGEDYSKEDESPVLLETIDFNAITGQVLDDETARQTVSQALQSVKFNLPEGIQQNINLDHSMFEAKTTEGKPIVEAPLDTHVDFGFMQGNIPVIGPGAKFKFVLDGNGQLTHMTMALPAVAGTGPVYPLISQQQADTLALKAYGASLQRAQNIKLNSQVVYWIPAGAGPVSQLVPQFLYGGTMTDPSTGEAVTLRQILIPAISHETEPRLVPKVQLFVDPGANVIYAGTEISGGTPPYSYSWVSSTTDLSSQSGASIEYSITPRSGQPTPTEEILTVIVTDAAGLSTSASETIPLTKFTAASSDSSSIIIPMAGGTTDVGTEWVGVSQGLSGSAGNAGGFASRFNSAGVFVRFNWGDFNAWERDFKDPAFTGGNDTSWIDNVDAAFYTGHANGDGFTFPSSVNDGFLHYNEARWGNNDLEWLVIAACGPLQLESGGKQWYQRWGPAFHGLHMICAYQNVSNDNTVEGTKYANYLLNGYKVRQAWIKTAIEVQPGSVRYGVMGVIGRDGMSNINDHFWGKGSVGPDIRGTDIIGYWLIHGPC
jgi:hypothetical protein